MVFFSFLRGHEVAERRYLGHAVMDEAGDGGYETIERRLFVPAKAAFPHESIPGGAFRIGTEEGVEQRSYKRLEMFEPHRRSQATRK